MNFARRSGQVQVDPDPHPGWDQGVILQVCAGTSPLCHVDRSMSAQKKNPELEFGDDRLKTVCCDGTGADAYNNNQVR